MSPVVKLLSDLVAIPSVNPSFAPAGHPLAGEHEVAAHLEAIGHKQGLKVRRQRVLKNRNNIFLTLPAQRRAKHRVVLAPHMDTVGGDLSDPKLFKPVIKKGRLHGRGSCDTKGSIAAMLSAIIRLSKQKHRPEDTEIVFIGLVDEESLQQGSRKVADSGYKADLAIVGEPTLLKVVTAHKGDIWIRFSTKGKMAHGSKPHLGVNAIHEAAKLVQFLETEYRAHLNQNKHPLLGPGTINVGDIRGGFQANIVPDLCSLTADRRTIPGKTDAAILRELKAMLKARGIKATIESGKTFPCLPLETDDQMFLVQSLMKTCRQRKGIGVDYFCDASPLSIGGIPSVAFGPGDISQAHTADEWISIESLEKGEQILFDFLSKQP